MTIKVQVAGAWVTVATGKFRVRHPTDTTDWIYPSKVRVCMNDGPGGTNRWIDSGYVGIPNAPTAFKNVAWDYDSMSISWAAPVANGIPVSGYRVTVVQSSPAGATRNFDTTALTQTFSVTEDTKYTVTVAAKGDTGVLGPATTAYKPWIGHSQTSTSAVVTKWKDWESELKYFPSTPVDAAIYRNEIEGIWIDTGIKADHLYINVSPKYPWVTSDGYVINDGSSPADDRRGEYIVASVHYNNIFPRFGTSWTETIALNQTTPGAYGIRLLGNGWSTAGGAHGLTGSMKAYGQQSYQDTVVTVTRTEQKNTLW